MARSDRPGGHARGGNSPRATASSESFTAFFAVIFRAGVAHSFEPVPPIFDLLRSNVGGLPACVIHPEGLSSSAGSAEITYYPGADVLPVFSPDYKRIMWTSTGPDGRSS